MLKKVPSPIKWISLYLFLLGIFCLFLVFLNNDVIVIEKDIFVLIILHIMSAGFFILGYNILRLLDWARKGTIILLYVVLALVGITIIKNLPMLAHLSEDVGYILSYVFITPAIFSIIPIIIIKYLLKHKNLNEIKTIK